MVIQNHSGTHAAQLWGTQIFHKPFNPPLAYFTWPLVAEFVPYLPYASWWNFADASKVQTVKFMVSFWCGSTALYPCRCSFVEWHTGDKRIMCLCYFNGMIYYFTLHFTWNSLRIAFPRYFLYVNFGTQNDTLQDVWV